MCLYVFVLHCFGVDLLWKLYLKNPNNETKRNNKVLFADWNSNNTEKKAIQKIFYEKKNILEFVKFYKKSKAKTKREIVTKWIIDCLQNDHQILVPKNVDTQQTFTSTSAMWAGWTLSWLYVAWNARASQKCTKFQIAKSKSYTNIAIQFVICAKPAATTQSIDLFQHIQQTIFTRCIPKYIRSNQ